METQTLNLTEAKVSDLEVVANRLDLRHDLHAFAGYVRTHEIKRGYRDNRIPQSHQQKLLKLMSDPEAAAVEDHWGDSAWIQHLDSLSLALGWVTYDMKGQYMGYSSSEPSFPDNFVKFKTQVYEQFLALSLQEQEEGLIEAHLKGAEACSSEFFSRSTLGRLDHFDGFGCGTGIVPTLSFARVRRHLLQLLARCPAEVWLSTASLIEDLRQHDRWFFIPKEIPEAVRKDAGHQGRGRYANFIERKRGDWSERDPIAASDPEGFEKVEGRYLERFLEGIPLVLGYTEVAYVRRKTETPIGPSRGLLPAFRVTERLRRAMRGEIPQPKVTVLPDFEVHVESLFYPAQTEAELQPLGELLQRGVVTVFKLTKSKVAAALAAQPDLDAAETLRSLSDRDLPANVAQELQDWAGHSEKFLLYEGFGVLEGRRETPGAEPFVVEAISPQFALVRSPDKLFRHLEAAEQVPLLVRHSDQALAVPPKVHSRVAPAARPAAAPEKKPLKIKRSRQTTLWFADGEAHAAFCKLLLDAKCVVPADRRALTVSYPPKAEPVIKACLKQFSEEYAPKFEDIDT